MKKEYIIVDDNNYWHSTCDNLEDAIKEYDEIDGEIADEVWLFEAKCIKTKKNN